MPSFILDYDSLESIAGHSSSLGKRAEEYGEELENQVIHSIEAVTGPPSGYLQSASDSVKDKVTALKQKSADFYSFADQVTKLLETAQQADQEVADAIAAKRDYFLEHHESLQLDDRKMKLLDLLVDIKNSNPILAEIADLLGSLSVNVESLNDSLKHWYRCRGKKPAKVADKEESSDSSIEIELKGQLLNEFLGDPLSLLLLSGTLEIPGLNFHVRNGKVYLKIETAEKYKNTVWSATGEFISGVGDTAVNTVTDLKDIVLHPIKTGRGIAFLANLSNKEKLELGAKIGTEIQNSFNANVIHGTPDTRAYFTGRALSEVALALIGAKGVDKAVKALKAGKVARTVKILDNLEEGASDLSKASNAIDEVEDSLDSVIKETYKPPKLNEEVRVAEGLTKGSGKYSETQIEKILNELQGDGFKNNPLRQAYEKEVSNLSKMKNNLLEQGLSSEEIAKKLHQARRDLGVKYKDATPQPLRDYIYELNQNRYGDSLGPTFEKLIANGKTYEQIIESASRPNADINKLLSGFEKWLRGQ